MTTTSSRRQFLQSSIAAAVAASLPTSQALAAALAAMSEVTGDVNAVTGAGAQVTLEKAAVKELSDALRRRCLYYYVEYPAFDKELQIVATRLPELGPRLSRQVVEFVQALRQAQLRKTPGIAETLDWAQALLGLGVDSLDADLDAVMDSMVCLLKTREDAVQLERAELERLVARAV